MSEKTTVLKNKPQLKPLCSNGVGNSKVSCDCSDNSIKYGKTNSGKQRFFCKTCSVTFVKQPEQNGYGDRYHSQIIQLTKEGLGIRSTESVLGISPATVLRKILQISSRIETPKTLVQFSEEKRIFRL